MPAQFISLSDYKSAPAPARGRHAFAAGASVAAHALAALAIIVFAPKIERPHNQWVLAYIVELGDSSGAAAKGNGGNAQRPPAAGKIASVPAKSAERKKKLRVRTARVAPALAGDPDRTLKPVPQTQPAPRRFASLRDRPVSPGDELGVPGTQGNSNTSRGGAGGSGSESNRGDSTGVTGGSGNGSQGTGSGAGNTAAHAEYGRNPAPVYPAIARRRAQQGTVTLRVLVAEDGAVKRVEIQQSSGVDSLDDSAIETVRTRWRFVPARRDGIAVESWVVVPIRFTLTDVSRN